MTKKKKLISRILFITIPIVLVLGAIGGFLVWYFNPYNKSIRAFEAQDYYTVVQLFDSLNEEKAEEIQDKLYGVAKEYHDEYLEEKCTYEEASDFFSLVTESVLKSHRKTMKLYERIETVYISREEYKKGIKLMDERDYLAAIDCFRKVSEEDELYIEKAHAKIEECKQTYIEILISEVDLLIENEEYEIAQELLVQALEYFPDEERLTEKLEEIAALLYSDIEGVWLATYDFGELIAAEMGLQGYSLYFPAELVFEFDGTYMKMYVNESSIEPALDAMCADAASMDALYVVAEQYGINKFEADVLVKLFYGGSYSAFLLDQYGTEINEALEAFKCDMKYTADSRKINLSEMSGAAAGYFDYQSEVSNTLKLVAYSGNVNPINVLKYPISFVRKLF